MSLGERVLLILSSGNEGSSSIDESHVETLLKYLQCALFDDINDDSSSCSTAIAQQQAVFDEVVLAALFSSQSSSIDSKLAKRILVDGLLPVAKHWRRDGDTARITVSMALLHSCIQEMLSACCYHSTASTTNNATTAVSTIPIPATITTTATTTTVAVETLLPAFIGRVTILESAICQNSSFSLVDQVLDRICCIPDDSATITSNRYELLPRAGAAVIACLREFENVIPHRLSQRLVVHPSTTSEPAITADNKSRVQFLLIALLRCLHQIPPCQIDSLPPLVYQICLLLGERTGIHGITPTQRMMCIRGIAARFEKVDDTATTAMEKEEMHWAQSTTLTHASTVIRQDPNLCKALLQCVKVPAIDDDAPPFRFMNVNPFLMALLLCCAAIPRQRQSCLDLIRDLVLEEASILLKRKERVWINCVVGSTLLEKPSTPSALHPCSSSSSISQMCVIQSLKRVVDFCVREGGSSNNLDSTLVQLGFVLVDCVKKDPVTTTSDFFSWPETTTCESSSPPQLAALSGLHLLSYMFRVFTNSDDGYSSSSSQRRYILQSAAGKVCGGAPNAIHHSRLLLHLTDHADSLAGLRDFVDLLIEWVGQLPSGGLPAAVIHQSLVPTLRKLLLLRRLARDGNSKSGNIDALFLYIRKSQIGIDSQKREAAASLLVMMLHVSITLQNHSASGDVTDHYRNKYDMVEEIQGYINKCLQQQRHVRIQVYYSLLQMAHHNQNEDGSFLESYDSSSCLDAVALVLNRQLNKYLNFCDDESNLVEVPPLSLSSCLFISPMKENTPEQLRKTCVLSRAMKRIKEPLPQLLQSCLLIVAQPYEKSSASSKSSTNNNTHELRSTLITLLLRVASCNLNVYFRDLDEMTTNSAVNKQETELALMLLLIAVLETMIEGSSLFFLKDVDNVEIPDYDEVLGKMWSLYCEAKERAILLIARTNKVVGNKSKSSVKSEKFLVKKSASDADSIASSALEKAKLQLKTSMLSNLWPFWRNSPTLIFLEMAFTKYGAVNDNKFSEDETDLSSEQSSVDRLHKVRSFRRYLFNRLLHYFHMMPIPHFNSNTIASVMKLGSLLFVESCSFLYLSEKESMAADAMRSLLACIKAIAVDLKDKRLPCNKIVAEIARVSFKKASDAFPRMQCSKLLERFIGEAKPGVDGSPADLAELLTLFALMSPAASEGGFLPELLANNRSDEAMLCCDILEICALAMFEPNAQAKIGAAMIQSWKTDGQAFRGPLGIGDGTNNELLTRFRGHPCPSSAAHAVQIALRIGGQLDGDSRVPCASDRFGHQLADENERAAWGFPADAHCDSDAMNTSVTLMSVANSLLAQCKTDHNFEDIIDEQEVLKAKRFENACISSIIAASRPDGQNAPKELSSCAIALCNALDCAITDVEFVLLKVIPSLKVESIHLPQKFVSLRLLAIAGAISTLTPCARNMDDDCSFATSVLQFCKRLYGANAKLHTTFITNPKIALSQFNKQLLMEMSSRTSPRCASLLLTVQEKSQNSGGRVIADSKIENQGKVASQVVFEKEKSDNALLKLAHKLKLLGLAGDSTWLESQVIVTASRGFKIMKTEINSARERETGNLKRKSGVKKKPKKKKKPKEERSIGSENSSSNKSVCLDIVSENNEEEEEGEQSDIVGFVIDDVGDFFEESTDDDDSD